MHVCGRRTNDYNYILVSGAFYLHEDSYLKWYNT